ncbi:MAG: insulinase family protein [Planctomycetales bacterium]|nr:insulinase family protein [Planctomycetales bacterium]
MKFRSQQLANGLEIVAECDDQAHSTALGFFVKAGSRDEDDTVAGVSHFLEHMMFKGTPTRSADDVNREFDEMGAHYNAYTTEENTVYYAAVLPEQQAAALELLADMLRPSLRADDFDMEKKVIIEEIGMYEDQPPYCADEQCKADHFGSHPLGRSVLGTEQSITELTVEQMRNYFERQYSARNIVLAAAGHVDFEALVAQTERATAHWNDVTPQRQTESYRTTRGACRTMNKSSSTQQYVLLLSDGPAADDDARYAAKILATVLGDDQGSRLYWELVDPGLAEHCSLSHYDYLDAGLMMTYLSCPPESAADNLRRVQAVYAAVEASGIDDAELARAKSKISSRVVLSSERPRGRLFTLGGNWLQRREYRTVRDDIDAVAAITADDVADVLRRFPLTTSTIVTVGPLESL